LPKTNSHYLGVLVRLAQRQGLDVDRLLAEIGVSGEVARADNHWIDNSYLTELVKRLWQETGDEILGIDEQPMRMGSWALVCDYMLAAENLGDLFRRGQRICSYLPPESMGLDFSLGEQSAVVGVRSYRGPRDPEHFLTEFLGVVWHRFPCWAVDVYLPVQQAFFSYPAPDHAWFYEELWQCEICFDQPFDGFTFDRKYLAQPVVRSAAELDVWLRNSPADLLYLPGRDTTVSTHIRRQLQGELSTNLRFPAFEQICDTLHMSSQVVRRRLAEEGTSYQKLKDAVRSGLVKELLARPELAIAEIAVRAGFTEPAALSRAFKKWTGQTPARYREDLLRQASDQ
jgi:AraC-like DNA-binding protein